MMSFMSERDLYDATVSLVPKNWTTENLKLVFEAMEFPVAFKNSLILSLMVMVLQLSSALLVGYGFGRFNFPFKNLFFVMGIFMLVVPPSTMILPLYLTYSNFDILNPTILFDDDNAASLTANIRLAVEINGKELRVISNSVVSFERVDEKWHIVKWDN